jgi:hypothetical protein
MRGLTDELFRVAYTEGLDLRMADRRLREQQQASGSREGFGDYAERLYQGGRELFMERPYKGLAAAGSLTGGAAFGAYTASALLPYSTAGAALATAGSVLGGMLLGGLFGFGVGGLIYLLGTRGKRKYVDGKPNPKYKKEEPRSVIKAGLDWMTEMNGAAKENEARAMPRAA